MIRIIAQAVSILLFAWYGLSALFSQKILQVAGSLGILVGYLSRPILLLSAAGLAVMMFLGVITRFRIKDPLYAAIPAFALCLLNLYIFAAAL